MFGELVFGGVSFSFWLSSCSFWKIKPVHFSAVPVGSWIAGLCGVVGELWRTAGTATAWGSWESQLGGFRGEII